MYTYIHVCPNTYAANDVGGEAAVLEQIIQMYTVDAPGLVDVILVKVPFICLGM